MLFQKHVTCWKSHVNMDFIVWQFVNQKPQPCNKGMNYWFVYFLAVPNARESWWQCINLWEVPGEDRILHERLPWKGQSECSEDSQQPYLPPEVEKHAICEWGIFLTAVSDYFASAGRNMNCASGNVSQTELISFSKKQVI